MTSKIKRATPFLILPVFILAAYSIYRQLHNFHWHELLFHIREIPISQELAALIFTIAGYAVMTVYDFLALKYIRHPLPYRKTAAASFLGYAFSNNVGFSMVAGASIRYRIYSAWGLSAIEITQVVLFCVVSLWLGFLGLSGTVFILEPMMLPQVMHLPLISVRLMGGLFLLILLVYLGLTLMRKKTIAIGDWHFSLLPRRLIPIQLLVGVVDWFLAGIVLYSLLPHPVNVPITHFLAVFLLAQLGGLISQVPGGLGIFESIVLSLLSPAVPVPQLLGALIVYRGIYYIVPLLIAIVILGIEEVLRRETLVTYTRTIAERVWVVVFAPMLSLAVFFTGAILLFSGSLPGVAGRLKFLHEVIPLPMLEISHLIGSLAGMGLLLLARGLQRRLDAAYLMTLILMGIGVAASLLKGFDYEEAVLLLLMFIILLPGRKFFYRKASLLSERFSAGWITAIAIIFITSVWLGLFSYRHVPYTHDLWWHFSLKGDAPRFLRATLAVMVLALSFSVARLIRPAPPSPHPSGEKEMETIKNIVSRSEDSSAHLAFLGDKYFLMNSAETAFIMYGISGQSWIGMGDPVGPESEWPELIWQFHRSAIKYADKTVFYEISHHHLHLYLDLGLVAFKLGEEARVPLTGFSLEGGHRKKLRYLHRKLTKSGCSFEIIPAEGVRQYLDDLQSISNAWLAEKNTREKKFSLGFFNADYLCKTPLALVRMNGRPMAFANIWQSADQEEVSIDLMRYLPGSPDGIMVYLFIEIMLRGQASGFRWFNLGMAPLSGMENFDAAPLWHKFGYWVAHHGDHFYDFQGLRSFKEKFHPVWTPKYLACPGGLALPRILTDIGALVSGGVKGILFK